MQSKNTRQILACRTEEELHLEEALLTIKRSRFCSISSIFNKYRLDIGYAVIKGNTHHSWAIEVEGSTTYSPPAPKDVAILIWCAGTREECMFKCNDLILVRNQGKINFLKDLSGLQRGIYILGLSCLSVWNSRKSEKVLSRHATIHIQHTMRVQLSKIIKARDAGTV